jgi:hypothetical protein
MTRQLKIQLNTHPAGFSRRQFIKMAVAAGLMAGCAPVSPSPVSQPAQSGGAATSPPSTNTPLPAATSTPTTIAVSTGARPAVIKIYPDGPSRVIRVRHPGVWSGETMNPEALKQLLDASITKLTGLNDAREAWSALFKPTEKIAIKVNAISFDSTHIPLVMAIAGRLQNVGVPAEQIVVFDRDSFELQQAGYTINKDGPGVRVYGTDGGYTGGWKLLEEKIKLSNILLNCDALINVPVLKIASGPGLSFGMKNHYGTFDSPVMFHNLKFERSIAELNALAPIKERTRLVIGDILTPTSHNDLYSYQIVGLNDTLLMSFDPVVQEAIGLQIAVDTLTAAGKDSKMTIKQATPWLENSAALGLGTNNPKNIDIVEVKLS